MKKLLLITLLLGLMPIAQAYFEDGVSTDALNLENQSERKQILRTILARYTSDFVDTNVARIYPLALEQDAELSQYITSDAYKHRIYQALLYKFRDEGSFYKLATFDPRKLNAIVKKDVIASIIRVSVSWYEYYEPSAINLRDRRIVASKKQIDSDLQNNKATRVAKIREAKKSQDRSSVKALIIEINQYHDAEHRLLVESYRADVEMHKALVSNAHKAMKDTITHSYDGRSGNLNKLDYLNIEDYL